MRAGEHRGRLDVRGLPYPLDTRCKVSDGATRIEGPLAPRRENTKGGNLVRSDCHLQDGLLREYAAVLCRYFSFKLLTNDWRPIVNLAGGLGGGGGDGGSLFPYTILVIVIYTTGCWHGGDGRGDGSSKRDALWGRTLPQSVRR